MSFLFRSRPNLPPSFERWREVDIIASSELLYEESAIGEIRSLERWLDDYARWRRGYDAFLKAEGTSDSSGFIDELDRRQYEHYVGLFFQSGQWRAILLLLLEDVAEPERSRYAAELDGILSDLRERMVRDEVVGNFQQSFLILVTSAGYRVKPYRRSALWQR